MSLPEGGFASAQDAEVRGEEGASYVWRRDEIEAVLGTQRAKSFFDTYELAPTREKPEFGVLRVRLPIESAIEREGVGDAAALLARFDASRAALLKARIQRTQPLRDDKVLVGMRSASTTATSRSRSDCVRAPRGRRAWRFASQACDEKLCLPPSRTDLALAERP